MDEKKCLWCNECPLCGDWCEGCVDFTPVEADEEQSIEAERYGFRKEWYGYAYGMEG